MNKKVIAVLLLGLIVLVGAFAPPLLRERIAIYAKEDSWIVNGADIEWYSDNRGTMVAEVDGSNGNLRIAAPTAVGTATPIINIENDSVADSIVSRNAAGTPTWILDKSGNVTASGTSSGPYDLNGNTLTIGADGGVTLDETSDDVVALTTGAGSGYFSILVGNLRVGNGSPTVSQDGEDLYVESQLEVDGEAQFDGAVDANSTGDVADTLTLSKGSGNALVVSSGGAIDINGAGDFSDTLTLSKGSGNALVISSGGAVDAQGAVDVDGAVTLNSTLDVDGNITSGTGAITMTDNVLIDGAADAEQLVIQGYSTQTNNPFVIEQSNGTDKFTVSNAGNTVIAGTLDAQGNISDSGGTLTIADNTAITGTLDAQGNVSDSGGALTLADNVAITGAADAIQLTITGYTTQTNVLQTWEQSGGSDVGTMSNAGALDVASTINYGTNNLYPLGYASSGYEIECGTTAVFTNSTSLVATALTTVTVPIAVQVTAPITTAAYLYVGTPSGITTTLTSLNSTFGTGTTGVQAHYCLVGNQ